MATEQLPLVDEPAAPESGPPRNLVFCIVSVALFMSSIDSTIVATALPKIGEGLHSTINWSGWTITVYSLGMVVALPIAGRVSDQYGRRRVFLFGITLFTVASLACGFAPNIYVLIVFRAIQALGGGTLQPSAAGVVADHFGRDRDRAIGLFGTVASGGQVAGPLFGGLIVGYLDWRWIFFVNVPVGILLVIAVIRVIPISERLERRSFDLHGLLLMGSFVLAANIGITEFGGRHTPLDAPKFLIPEVLGLVLLCLFVHHTRTAAEPFIPARFFKARGFAVMNAENLMWGAFGFGAASLFPLYAQDRYHLAALSSGTLLAARGIGAIAVGALAAFGLRRTGYRLPMMVGFSVVALGVLLISIAPRFGISPYLWISIGAGITGLGNGMANPASRNACLQIAPEEVSAITGLRQMFVYMGIIFSVSIETAILNRTSNPGLAQAHTLWVIAALLAFVMAPLVLRVPEHKGRW